jgi:hypothetical protein
MSKISADVPANLPGAAPVDEAVATPPSAPRRRRLDLAALVISMTAVVTVSLYRVVTLGFVPVAPDDAAYIGVGRAIWGFREPLGIDGSLFTIRSWVYPAMVGGASRLFGGDPFAGPRVLGWTLATVALALAVFYGFRLSRGLGAIATGFAILAAPLIWTTVPTTRVEVGLICSMMVLLLVMDTASPRRMLIGGILAGVTLLIKETSAPLIILPLAYLGTVPRPDWLKLALRYVIGFGVTVGWWFLTVLISKHEVFPFSALRQTSGRDIPRGWQLNSSGKILVGLWIAGWLVVAIGRRRDPRARVLILAAIAFLPAAFIAYEKGFALRQFVPIGLLSSIALGVAAADILTAVMRRVPRGAAQLVGAVVIVIGLVATVPVVLTQDRTPIEESKGDLDEDLAAYFAARPGEPAVLTSFKFKAQFWARVEGDAVLSGMPFTEVDVPPKLPDAVWVDATGRNYRVMPRANMVGRLRDAEYMVLSGPHRFGPIALATWLNRHGHDVGLTRVAQFGPKSATSWAYVYKVDDPQVDKIPTIVTSDVVDRIDAAGGFTPVEPTVIAGTRGWLARYALDHPTDGTRPYQPLRSLPR